MIRIFIFIFLSLFVISCNNEDCQLKYSSPQGAILLGNLEGYGTEIVSHEYENGYGVITFDEPINTIPKSAFKDCHIRSLIIPCSVTSIEEAAFFGCANLASVTIPNSVVSIGDHAFDGCSGLTSVIIGSGVTLIGDYAFEKCSNLTSIIIPDNVTTIGDHAFDGCSGLTSVMIGSGVTSVGEHAFDGCMSLTSITIGSGVNSIGNHAFNDCRSIEKVYISEIANWCNISFGDNPLYKGANLYCNGELITNLTIPDCVPEIRHSAFRGCSSLKSVVISDSTTLIGSQAFYDCRSLTNITIGIGVTLIENEAFMECNLKEIYCKAETPPIGRKSLLRARESSSSVSAENFAYYLKNGISKTETWKSYNCTIYVPHNSVDAYKSAKGWEVCANQIVGYDF